MTSRDSVAIPIELIDHIIDEVGLDPDVPRRQRALASIALCSWSCRHRAHGHLFAKVDICGTTVAHMNVNTVSSRIRQLLELIKVDPYSETTGIASYIKHFSIYMTGPSSMIRPTLDDGTVASILRKLFKTGEPNTGHRSFFLALGIYGTINVTFDWNWFNSDFLDAFHGLCRNPLLTTLKLARFTNLPRDIFRNSLIKDIRMENIRLSEDRGDSMAITPPSVLSDEEESISPDIPLTHRDEDAVRPESVDIDFSFPLCSILDLTPNKILPLEFIFSELKTLRVQISQESHYRMMSKILQGVAMSLQSLEINLRFKQLDTDVPRLELYMLSSLKTLNISHVSTSYKNPGWSCMPQICSVLRQPYFPDDLQDISLKMLLYSMSSNRSPIDIVEGYPYHLLDDLFSHSRFRTLKRLTLIFNFNLYLSPNEPFHEREFQERAIACVRNSFPSINSSPTLALNINIVPCIRYAAMLCRSRMS